MPRFRWRCHLRKGRWLPTRELAEAAAVRQGLAHYDEVRGRTMLGPLVEIEEGE